MIEITNLVTLSDDNQYVVVSKVVNEGITYYYFVDINNNQNIKFLYEDNGDLVEIEDGTLISNLLPLFYEKVKDVLSEKVIDEVNNAITPEMIEYLNNTNE